MKFIYLTILTLLPSAGHSAASAQTPNRPFPQHAAYAAGAITPNHLSRDVLDRKTREFYREWKRKYVVQGCGAGRYYVATSDDHGKEIATVSEAIGYGMIIMALMDGEDAEAKAIFDGMYHFFRDHPSAKHPDLMSWKQDIKCQNVETTSATDGDLDIAYALLLADKQWGSAGAINYRAEALKVARAVMEKEIHHTNFHVMLGSWAQGSTPAFVFGTRTSDFMTHHLKVFRAATGDQRWASAVDRTYRIVEAVQRDHSRRTGLLPDFVVDTNARPKPAPPDYIEAPTDGDYSFNACRVPWRLATDYLVTGDARAKAATNKVNSWVRSKTRNDPARIRAGYRLNGDEIVGYSHMAFVAPFGVGAMVDRGHQRWLNALWDATVSKPVGEQPYFGNTLKMLCLIVMSGNWWSP